MSRFRFSLFGLLSFVSIVALGCAALSSGGTIWANWVFSSAIVVILVAVLAAVYSPHKERPFWVGVVLFGTSYTVLAFAPWFEAHVAPRLITTTGLELLQSSVESRGRSKLSAPPTGARFQELAYSVGDNDFFESFSPMKTVASSNPSIVEAHIDPTNSWRVLCRMRGPGVTDVAMTDQGGRQRIVRMTVGARGFVQVGQSLIAILVSFLGGLLAEFFAKRSRQASDLAPADATILGDEHRKTKSKPA